MTPLWIAIALLLLPALWLLVAPMRGARVLRDQLDHFEANDTSAEQNVAIFQRRMASLEAARERGDIDVPNQRDCCMPRSRVAKRCERGNRGPGHHPTPWGTFSAAVTGGPRR